MASSGTFNFAPSTGEFVMQALARAGVRRSGIENEHLVNARVEANLLFGEWANRQINLFSVDQEVVPLIEGQATYAVPASTVDILDTWIATLIGNVVQDRVILSISRSDYAGYPDKTTTGTPTVYWFDRQIVPTLTLWQPPDENAALNSTLKYNRVTQIEDANLPGGEQPAVPYRFYDAFVAGLAHRLARIYSPATEQARSQDAQYAWSVATAQDTEHDVIRIMPGFSGYYR
jgi:hypothetical protein